MKPIRVLGLALALSVPLAACDDDENPVAPDPPIELPATVVDIATSSPDFSTLVGALQSAGLVETLQGDGPFTVFAPTNAAFSALPALALNKVTGDVNLLTDVLTYHVVPGAVPASDVVNLSSAPTVNGKSLSISVQGGSVFVDGVRVSTTDLFAENGVVHVIDGVLLPEPVLDIVETAQTAGSFNTLLTAVEAAGLTETLRSEGPFTVFAPSDAAFEKLSETELGNILADGDLLTRVLTYHVVAGDVRAADVVNLSSAMTVNGKELAITVEGGEVFLDGIRVVTTDIVTTNGVIHVIEDVLLPEPVLDIVETASQAGSFNTLVSLVQEAGLVETLTSEGPFTVFAPSDDAFAALSDLETLNIVGDGDLLSRVLTYHVVAGEVRAADVVNLTSATTVNGREIAITVENGEVFLDGIRVVTTDIETTNGIIHVIEGVLLPEPVLDIVEAAFDAGSFSTLLTAVEAAGLTETLKGDGPFTVLAPTDDAFAKIPAETLNALLADVDALTNVLTYHVIAGEVPAATVVTLPSATTLQGSDVTIAVAGDGTVTINDATVLITDILTTNGVIHVIDTVLLPDA